ncbi:MAG: FHA domain-containing protein [Cellvibrionaceae bacterium]|nr:FHA domain-containing protein [Cellvibrionaceae bacterium]
MALVVQLVNRAGAVLSTQKFPQNKIVIGRALDCDLILQDPHVEPRHLEVELDPATQGLYGRDLSTLNGTWRVEQNSLGVPGRTKSRLFSGNPFFSGQLFEVGRTHLRICSAAHEVAPAIRVSRWEILGHGLSHWWLYSLLILVLVVLQVWDAYLSDPKDNKLSQYALGALYPILAAVGFAGLWGFIGKNIRHDAKFPTHFSAALAALLAVSAFEFSAPYWAFQFGVWLWQGTIVALFTALVVFALGYVTLSFATHLPSLVRTAVAAILPVVILIPTLLTLLGQTEFESLPPYDRAMVEPAAQFRAVTEVEEFLQATHKLYAQPLDEPIDMPLDKQLDSPHEEPETDSQVQPDPTYGE